MAWLLRTALILIFALAPVAGAKRATWVEICAGETTVTIAVDENGTPVSPHPDCPDCRIIAAALTADLPAPTAPQVLAGRIDARTAPPTAIPGPALTPSARGPPGLA